MGNSQDQAKQRDSNVKADQTKIEQDKIQANLTTTIQGEIQLKSSQIPKIDQKTQINNLSLFQSQPQNTQVAQGKYQTNYRKQFGGVNPPTNTTYVNTNYVPLNEQKPGLNKIPAETKDDIVSLARQNILFLNQLLNSENMNQARLLVQMMEQSNRNLKSILQSIEGRDEQNRYYYKQIIQKIEEQARNSRIEFKDRLILFSTPQETSTENIMISKMIGSLLDQLCQQAFNAYFKQQMNEKQTKIFMCNNIILNTFLIVSYFRDAQFRDQIKIETIQRSIQDCIRYLKLKYPQKDMIDLNEEETNFIKYTNTELPEANMLHNFKFQFTTLESQTLLNNQSIQVRLMKQVKVLINKVVKQSKNSYFYFKQFMVNNIFQSQTKSEAYKIGSKLSENTKYLNIQETGIKIKDSAVLRVIMKWNQQLQTIVRMLNDHQDEHWKKKVFYTKSLKRSEFDQRNLPFICQRFKEIQRNIKFGFRQQRLSRILAYINPFIQKTRNQFVEINQQNLQIGIASDIALRLASDRSINNLIYNIKLLLEFKTIVSKTDNKLMVDKNGTKISDFDFVEFGVSDLFRCKFTGNIVQLQQIFKQLKKFTTILRVKNRIKTSNMDYLINFKLPKTELICQIQLALKLKKDDKKEQFLDHFNHFLYELQRSQYGPIVQCGLINANLNQSIKYFLSNLKKENYLEAAKIKLKEYNLIPRVENCKIILNGHKAYQNTFVFICDNCIQLIEAYSSYLTVFIKKDQNKIKYCGRCVVNTLHKEQRSKLLLNNRQLYKFFCEIEPEQMLQTGTIYYQYYLVISNKLKDYTKMYFSSPYGFVEAFSCYKRQQQLQFRKKQELDIQYVYQVIKKDNAIYQHKIPEIRLQNKSLTNFQVLKAKYISEFKKVYPNSKWIVLVNHNQEQLVVDFDPDLIKQKIEKQKKKTARQEFMKQKITQKLDIKPSDIDDQIMGSFIEFHKHIIKSICIDSCLIQDLKWLKGTKLNELRLINNKRIQSHLDLRQFNTSQLLILDLSKNKLQSLQITTPSRLLNQLNLQSNRFTFLPPNLCNISLSLNLKTNLIQTITLDTSIDNIEKLQLDLNPLKFFKLQSIQNKIKVISFKNCQLSKIELSVPFVCLQSINLQSNQFAQFPYELLTDSLRYINLSNNQIHKVDIKHSITSLEEMLLDNNLISEFAVPVNSIKKLCLKQNIVAKFEFPKQQSLQELSISLTINIPEIAFSQSMVKLDLQLLYNMNQVKGSYIIEGQLQNLKNLKLTITEETNFIFKGKLENLKVLHFQGNSEMPECSLSFTQIFRKPLQLILINLKIKQLSIPLLHEFFEVDGFLNLIQIQKCQFQYINFTSIMILFVSGSEVIKYQPKIKKGDKKGINITHSSRQSLCLHSQDMKQKQIDQQRNHIVLSLYPRSIKNSEQSLVRSNSMHEVIRFNMAKRAGKERIKIAKLLIQLKYASESFESNLQLSKQKTIQYLKQLKEQPFNQQDITQYNIFNNFINTLTLKNLIANDLYINHNYISKIDFRDQYQNEVKYLQIKGNIVHQIRLNLPESTKLFEQIVIVDNIADILEISGFFPQLKTLVIVNNTFTEIRVKNLKMPALLSTDIRVDNDFITNLSNQEYFIEHQSHILQLKEERQFFECLNYNRTQIMKNQQNNLQVAPRTTGQYQNENNQAFFNQQRNPNSVNRLGVQMFGNRY